MAKIITCCNKNCKRETTDYYPRREGTICSVCWEELVRGTRKDSQPWNYSISTNWNNSKQAAGTEYVGVRD